MKRKRNTNNNRYFQVIPQIRKGEKMNDYVKFQERMNELVKAKQELETALEELKETRKLYNEYLNKNPYKKERVTKENKVEELRKFLMEKIPNKFV